MTTQLKWGGCEIRHVHGDLTTLEVDAIVNAANERLAPGGGVCGAIHRRGGPDIARECSAIVAQRGPVPTGRAAITTGGDLPARHVIHAVGPIYDRDPDKAAELLAETYRSVLAVAREHGLRSVAFPCISTGIYGFPEAEAAEIATRTVRDELERHDALDLVVFCTFTDRSRDLYDRLLDQGGRGE